MRTVEQLLGGVRVLAPPQFNDPRGVFTVSYEARAAADAGLPARFVQDNHSLSFETGTVRGIHLQLPPHEQGKLVRVLRGRIFDVVVDLRPESPSVGRWASVELDAVENHLLWVPGGFGHGFCTLEPDTEVFYKVDTPYRPDAEISLAWDDPTLAIPWPVDHDRAVLSDKDLGGLTLNQTLAAIAAAGVDRTSVVEGHRP